MITWPVVRTLGMEARGEPVAGQQAVAHVMWNRARDGRWGKTLAEVCLWNAHVPNGGQTFQFSGWRSQDPNFAWACRVADNDPSLVALTNILIAAETAPDLTGGALFYYNPRLASPYWAPTMRKLGTFGNQVFLTDKPAPKPSGPAPLVA